MKSSTLRIDFHHMIEILVRVAFPVKSLAFSPVYSLANSGINMQHSKAPPSLLFPMSARHCVILQFATKSCMRRL